jgi:hypothetical protein
MFIPRRSPLLEFRQDQPQADECQGDGKASDDHFSADPIR